MTISENLKLLDKFLSHLNIYLKVQCVRFRGIYRQKWNIIDMFSLVYNQPLCYCYLGMSCFIHCCYWFKLAGLFVLERRRLGMIQLLVKKKTLINENCRNSICGKLQQVAICNPHG